MQRTLAIMFFVAIAMMACGPSAIPKESEPSTNAEYPKESGPALLLSEESAISILQTFLQECLPSWDRAYQGQMTRARSSIVRAEHFARRMGTVFPTSTPRPPDQLPQSEQEKRSWLMNLATETTGDFAWSASYHGVTKLGGITNEEAETWVVIGPGLEKAGSQLVVPGRWKVYAGIKNGYYLDAPARFALDEYNRFETCYLGR